MWVYFWVLYSAFSLCLLMLGSTPHCLGYRGSKADLQVTWRKSTALTSFFLRLLEYSKFFAFLQKFQNQLVNFDLKAYQNYDQDCTEFIHQLSNCHLNNIESFNRLPWYFSPFIYIFNFSQHWFVDFLFAIDFSLCHWFSAF